MEEPYQKNGATCRFPVINLVMAGGDDGLLPPPHSARGEFHHKDISLSMTEDPYQNNAVTCRMPFTDLVRGDSVKVPHMLLLPFVLSLRMTGYSGMLRESLDLSSFLVLRITDGSLNHGWQP